MFKKIAERLVVFKPFSWEKMVGTGQVCLLLMFQIFLWILVVNSALTRTLAGAMLIVCGAWWIMHGIYPLLIENRSTSVTIGCRVIIASGCCIIGLGIAMIIPLMTEVDWVPRMAGIFYSLAFLVWLFVIMKVAPIITRWLLIGVVFCVIAIGYALVCNVWVVTNALVSDVPHVRVSWDLAIGFMVSGGAMIGWTILVMRKTAPVNFRLLVPAFVILGIIYIGFGIVTATVLISR